MSKVRTRFAPSPTGRMHVGNLRTALYEFLIAKHAGGDFILRIEDTDRERYVEGAVDIIYRTLEATGLVHDEGPDKDKGYGPYIQSERQASGLYLEYAKKLIESGDAYYCFCDKERLATLKTSVGEDGKEITMYDKHCLHLSQEEIQANLDAGKPYVIRMNMPTEGTTTFVDELYGEITVENKELDDMILIKSDGYPTYNFANVIDDHLQEITHVVRGNEYISSSPKYQRLYEAFGWEAPKYVHLPLITDENHKKLSKRSGHSSYEDLVEQGFLPEAIVNYIALLGWSPEDNQEIFSLDELIKNFDYHKVNKSPSVFDITKLKWMNGEYIKAMDNEKFYEMARPYVKEVIKKDLNLETIMDMVKTRIETFPEIGDMIDFFQELPEYSPEMYTHKKMKTNSENSLEILKEYEAKDKRVKVIEQKNAGAGAARNNGLAIATGEYLSFLDSDDFFEPDMLEKAYEKGKSSNAQVVVFRSDQYREDLNEFVQVKWTLREKQIPPYRPMNCRSFTGNIFKVFVGWAWDKLFERKFVEENHLKFQQIRTSNDMLFVFSALAFAQRMEIVDLVLAHQRRNNPNSLSNTREKSWDCFHTALNALKDALTAHGNFWEFEQDYINYALHFSLWHLDTITGAKKEVLFNKLKNEWFAEFGIDSLPAERFYDKKEYAKYLKIKSNEFNAYYEE